ncbi:MAG: hypothetical protein H0T56_17430 [Pseudaminobacter sp.]|nr:hypothetical protein [Pseudaminobacter sp.]
MNSFTPRIFRAIGRYAGKVRTMRDEIRTERFLNSLPDDIRKDIGWPDSFAERRSRRG